MEHSSVPRRQETRLQSRPAMMRVIFVCLSLLLSSLCSHNQTDPQHYLIKYGYLDSRLAADPPPPPSTPQPDDSVLAVENVQTTRQSRTPRHPISFRESHSKLRTKFKVIRKKRQQKLVKKRIFVAWPEIWSYCPLVTHYVMKSGSSF